MRVPSLGQEDPCRRAWHAVFLPGESHGQMNLQSMGFERVT